jgi:hypothetical protein
VDLTVAPVLKPVSPDPVGRTANPGDAMTLPIVGEKPAHTGSLSEIRTWMRAPSTRDAWMAQNVLLGGAFATYMADQEPDDVRRVFCIEPVCQLKEDAGIRGRGIHLFALKDFEDALWTGFAATINRRR